MNHRGARGLAAAALAVLMAVPGAAAGARDRTSDLRELVDSFVAHRLARAPYAARRPAADGHHSLASTVAAGTLDAERGWLRGFRNRLADPSLAEASDPSGERAAVRALLLAAVQHDSLVLEAVRPFDRDPGAYVALVAGSVEAALDRTTSPSCAGVKLAVQHLSEVPEVLRAARVNLRNPPRILTERAIERYAEVLRFYRRDLPRLASGCRNPHLQADLAEADTLAVRAVEAFRVYLEDDLLPASRGELAIGPDVCHRLLAAALMAEVAPVESLLAAGVERVDACRAELDSLASGISEAGTRAALDSLAVAAPEDGNPVAAGQRAVARVHDFLRSSDLVTVPAKLPLRVRSARALDELDGVRLVDGDAGAARGTIAWLAIAPADSADLGAEGDRCGRWERELAVAGEATPGRLMRELGGRGPWTRLGLAMADVWDGEDWGQYCQRMVVEQGYGGQDRRYLVARAARALRDAGRSLASLALLSGAMSPAQAHQMLEDRCLIEPARAEREVRRAASDVGLMGYTMGAERLLELRNEASQRLGPRFRLRSFHDAVLHGGVAPFGSLRERVWQELTVTAGNDSVGAKP